MKHSYILLSSLVLLACCTNENEFVTPENAVEGNTVLVATAEQFGTRANYVKDNGQFFWTYGDNISVTTTNGQRSFGISSGAGTATATFFGNLDEDEEITGYAWYNGHRHSASWYSIEGDSVMSCELNSDYWVYEDYDREFNTEAKPDAQASNIPLFAKFNKGEDLNFKMLCGGVAIQLKNLPENARWIQFSTDKKIRGGFNVDITAKEPQINTSSIGGEENYVRIYLNSGVDSENMVFYIPLPCGTYEKFEITVWDDEDNPVGTLVSEKTRVVKRCQIRYFSDTEVEEFVDEDLTDEIEDPALLSWLLDRYDRDGDGRLSTVEAWQVESIDNYGGEHWDDSIGQWMSEGEIRSLKGIEIFQNLRYVSLPCHQIESADCSKNPKLERINLECNKLKSLDVTGCASLRDINIYNNSRWIDGREIGLGEVKEIKGLETCTNLRYLNVENNQIESLDLSNCTKLENLSCTRNPIATLDVSGNPELRSINCSNSMYWDNELGQNVTAGNLKEIVGLAGCSKLESIDIAGNKFEEIDLSGFANLGYARLSDNQITQVVVNSSQLYSLDCANNKVEKLELNAPNLSNFNCDRNQITELDLSGFPMLRDLSCHNNPLTTLDISVCPELIYLRAYSTKLTIVDLSKNLNLYGVDFSPCDDLKTIIIAPDQSFVGWFSYPEDTEIVYSDAE